MKRTYDDLKLAGVAKKRFLKKAKGAVASAAPLRLVGSGSRHDEIEKNRLVEEMLQRHTQLLQLTHDAIHIRRFRSGRIVYWNGSARKLYGWSADQAMGRVAHELLQTRFPQPLRNIKAELSRNGCWEGELAQIKKDGSQIVTESRWSLRQGLDGSPIDILEVNHDLADKKLSLQKAQEIERLALLGTMAAVFAHEVASPLTGISSSLQFVERELAGKQVTDDSLITIVQGAMREIDRLGSLLNGFRSVARPQPLDLKCADLFKLIQEVLALEMITYQAAGITVKLEFESAVPPVELDAAKMKQVILNLCKNAIEAMPAGGCLTLKGYQCGRMVVLEISDSGMGVPDDVNVFELFATTKPAGSGLGLPLAAQLVSAHKGTIDFTTEPGRGTTFKVCLPAAE
jgi:PAS domain S-box-containing protein